MLAATPDQWSTLYVVTATLIVVVLKAIVEQIQAIVISRKVDKAASKLETKLEDNTQISRDAFKAANNFNEKLANTKTVLEITQRAEEDRRRIDALHASFQQLNTKLDKIIATQANPRVQT